MTVNYLYGYTPNLPANSVGCALFGVILISQLVSGLYTRDWWLFFTWSITAGLEFAGYIGRALSHNSESFPLYKMQLVCIIIAPAFMAAGLYYQLAQQVTIYGQKYSPVRPMIYNAIFTTGDVISLFIQAIGGGIAAANVDTPSGPDVGAWIMVGGIAFQVFVLVCFILVMIYVNLKIYQDDPANWDPNYFANRERPMFKFWIPTVGLSLFFLLLRSIYRIIELSEGWVGYLMTTERYILILDGLMIVLGMAPLCIIYPDVAHGYVAVDGLHYDSRRTKNFKDITLPRAYDCHSQKSDWEKENYDLEA